MLRCDINKFKAIDQHHVFKSQSSYGRSTSKYHYFDDIKKILKQKEKLKSNSYCYINLKVA